MGAVDILVLIVSIFMIIVVMMQSSKDDINDAFSGSKTDLFKNQKSRGLEAVLQKATWVIGILFLALTILTRVL